MKLQVLIAEERHTFYAHQITTAIEIAARERGTGIARRSPEYIVTKIKENKAVIALEDDKLAGFCYIETWSHEKYVANSGLIILPGYRKSGLAKLIKAKAFEHSRKKYPEAKIFGITTSLPVMKINADLGYRPVTFSELTTDEAFWKGCQSCPNYDILTRTNRSHCLCTGMVYDPAREAKAVRKTGLKERWQQFKQFLARKKPVQQKNETQEPAKH